MMENGNKSIYTPPRLYVITCSVEDGFTLSGFETPDFDNENEL